MSYKTTLLKETRTIISDIKNEILEIIRRNEKILAFENLNEWDIKLVEDNMKIIEQKESLIRLYKQNIQEILKMDNAA